MGKNTKNKSKIRRKITFFICITALVVIGVGIGVRYTFGYRMIVNSESESYIKVARVLALSVKKEIDNHGVGVGEFGSGRLSKKTLDQLSFLGDFRSGLSGHVLLTDNQGRILWHPDFEKIGLQFLDAKDLESWEKVPWKIINDSSVYGEKILAASAGVNHPYLWENDANWLIFVVQDLSEVLNPLDDMVVKAVFLSIFLMLALIPTGFIFSGLYVRPLKKLCEFSQKIQDGDWNSSVQIETGDEIEELADSFSQMIKTIKTNQHNIVQANLYSESIISNMVEGIIMFDNQGEIRTLNPKAKVMLEINENDCQKSLADKLEVTNLDKAIEDCKIRKEMVIKEIIVPGEKNLLLCCGVFPVKNSQQEIIGVLITLRDITYEKHIESLKTDFVSVVSHELRTPLATIKEGVSLVLDKVFGDTTPKQNQMLSVIHKNIERLERIVNDLLDISKIESGNVELRIRLINLSTLTKEIVNFFEPKMKDKCMSINLHLSSENIKVYADSDKITQVFTNLISNSMKFVKRGGIDIFIQERADEVECIVADTGIGISKENLHKVFSKFQQFERVAGAGEKGTGLGLSVVKGIINMHKGTIRVESEYGKGSKFIFNLPHYSLDQILEDIITQRIGWARRVHRDFALFVYSFYEYSKLEESLGSERAENLFQRTLQALEEAMKGRETPIFTKEKEIVFLADTFQQDAAAVAEKFKRVIKDTLFEVSGEKGMNFSYGFAAFPGDGNDKRSLVEAASSKKIDELKTRLNKRIMIVDDEPTIVKTMGKMLERWGYSNVVSANNGEEALSIISDKVPDLLILDIRMPQLNGYEVIGRLKENKRTKDIPILIMSGYEIKTEQVKEYIKNKVILTLGKPVNLQQLEDVVAYLL
ncbi:MAG: response regulator [Candidatus Omnitrophica bacterium]|nr:response regulator [Candidatus Omnitrophota bacterium]